MAHEAMSMLSKEKTKIDIMIINVNSSNFPDSLCFKLLAQAVALNIISIVVCAEYNKLLAKDVMHNRAYLYMKRPLCEEIVKNLWQFVLREEKRREKTRKELETNEDQINVGEQHGKERCYPSDILEVMNVPNLTKDQISSHLQKYRNNNWRPPKEIKYVRQGSSSGSQQRNSYNTSSERKKRTSCMKFGRMPNLQTNLPNQTQISPQLPPVNTNYIFDGLTQQQLYHPHLQVQPYYLNPFLLAQNDIGGGLQQQHGLLFGMSGSKSPIIESINYRSDIGVENVRTNELGATNANYQQYIGEQNMSHSSNIAAATNVNNIDGNNPNEWENCDAYFNFNNMNDLFEIPKSPSATLPNEHDNGSEIKCPISENRKYW